MALNTSKCNHLQQLTTNDSHQCRQD